MSIASNQRRLRRLVAGGARRLLTRIEPDALAPPAPPPPPPVPREEVGGASAPVPPRSLANEQGSATMILRAKVEPHEAAAVEERISLHPELEVVYAEADQLNRERLLLSFGIFLQIREISERTGLPMSQPPDEVHTMSRGPLSSAGGLYEADLIAAALASVGVDIAAKRSALDFGCSSGRVLRVLANAYPEVTWHGCDPNAPAIAWAREAIASARFFRSPERPPLDLPSGSLDLVYAISIWSHLSPQLGQHWLDEMHRLLRPGGHLLLTTHGATTVAHDGANGLREPAQLARIRESLATRGAWYAAEFGEQGDWGVIDPEWGTTFLTPEWLLAHLTPRWRLLEFVPGRLHGNQDVYVLQRA
jgi:SAM-dependent methyltransferase